MWQDPPSIASDIHKLTLHGCLIWIENIAKLKITKANMHIILYIAFLQQYTDD